MKSEFSRRIMDVAREKAKEIGKGSSIIVVDVVGIPKCMELVNDVAPTTSTFITEAKSPPA